VLSTVLTGACRPCPVSPEGTAVGGHGSPNGTSHHGVDAHLGLHVAAVLDRTGRPCGTQGFPASTRGYVALVAWAERFGPVQRVGPTAPAPTALGWPGSCAPMDGGRRVNRPDRSLRRRHGKPDPIDAQAAAGATLAGVAAATPRPVRARSG
jgi:transposase